MVDSSQPLIFEISSDSEEEDFLFNETGTVDSDCDWLSELFPEQEDERETQEKDSDSDDVVVITEILLDSKKKILDDDDDDDDDDDCVVLEDDPDKRVEVESEGGSGSDDLVIVGEKGQIACRDYPHARHLCAKFIFASTPHEQHCHQCHCYVCDALAPCVYWGNGSSATDHCHSTDQDPLWKAQRQYLKVGNKAPFPLIHPPDVTLSLPPPQQTIPVPTSMPALNQTARLSKSSISRLTHQQRSHPTLHTSPMDKFNPVLVSQQLLSSCNNNSNANQIVGRHTSPMDKFNPVLVSQQLLSSCDYNSNANQVVGRQTPKNLEAQYLNRPRIFKKPGHNMGTLPSNHRSGYGTTNNKYASQYPRNSHPSAISNRRRSTYQRKHSINGSHSQQNYGCSSSGLVPPSQAQENGSNSFVNSVPGQPPTFNNQFANSVTSQQPSLQTNMGSTILNPLAPPFYPSKSYFEPNMGTNNFDNSIPCQYQALQPNTGSGGFINPMYSQTQTYNQPNYSQQGNETLCAMNPSSTVVGSTDHYNGMDSFPAQDPALSRDSHQSAGPEYSSSLLPENTDNQFSYFCEPDNWFGEYVGTDGFELGPSEAATVDTGGLFDHSDPAFD